MTDEHLTLCSCPLCQEQKLLKKLHKFVENYLETQTTWGKIARPSQIRAAAKRMVGSHRLPVPVAKALGLVK
jgi:hypothetical protein